MIISHYYLYRKTHQMNIRDILHCPHRFLWKARQYGYKSNTSGKKNQTKFFKQIGFYTEQWIYLFRFLGFWNKTTEQTDLNGGTPWNHGSGRNYNIFFKKKQKYNTSIKGGINDRTLVDVETSIKYLNKKNGGFNVTIFNHNWARLVSIHPGKSGMYAGSNRRKTKALFSWWHFLFTKLTNKANYENEQYAEYVEKINSLVDIKQTLYIHIKTTNNMFLRYFFVFKNYFSTWPKEEICIYLSHNFKKLNLVLKKKRYMKKFKRKFTIPSDRVNRRTLLVKPYKNVVSDHH